MDCKGINFFRDLAIPIRSFVAALPVRAALAAVTGEDAWDAKRIKCGTKTKTGPTGIVVAQKPRLYYIFQGRDPALREEKTTRTAAR